MKTILTIIALLSVSSCGVVDHIEYTSPTTGITYGVKLPPVTPEK